METPSNTPSRYCVKVKAIVFVKAHSVSDAMEQTERLTDGMREQPGSMVVLDCPIEMDSKPIPCGEVVS